MVTRWEKLRRQQEQLGERIKTLQSKQRHRDRRRETRRKVLLGALLQRWMETEPGMRLRVEHALPAFLSRQVDREVFGLDDLSSGRDVREAVAAEAR